MANGWSTHTQTLYIYQQINSIVVPSNTQYLTWHSENTRRTRTHTHVKQTRQDMTILCLTDSYTPEVSLLYFSTSVTHIQTYRVHTHPHTDQYSCPSARSNNSLACLHARTHTHRLVHVSEHTQTSACSQAHIHRPVVALRMHTHIHRSGVTFPLANSSNVTISH